jgi:titin
LKDTIVSHLSVDEDDTSLAESPKSPRSNEEDTTLDEIRNAIANRNQNACRPKFLVKPKPRKQIEEFKSLRLKTAVSANPTPEVQWDRNGIILETGNKFSIYNDGDFAYLEVHHVSVFDSGFYNCTATNSEGFATCTSEVDVLPLPDTAIEKLKKRTRREPHAPSFIEVLPGRQKAAMGESLSVECSVNGYPSPSISWQRNGCSLIPQPDRCFMYYDGECATLKFVNISMADAGTYACSAENGQGQASTQMNLDVTRPATKEDDGLPPKFLHARQRLKKIVDGDAVTLKAEIIEGTEPITCRWIRNKIELVNSSSLQIKRDKKDACVVLTDAFPEDSGEYVCVAENKYGAARCSVDLFVTEQLKSLHEDEKPTIKATSRAVQASPGGVAEIRCTVIGQPEPVISWTRNDEQIIPNSKYDTVSSGSEFMLRIRDIQSNDAGTYALTAVNSAGSTKETVQLNVTENFNQVLPRFVRLPVSVQCSLGQKAELSCEFEGEPTPQVSWYRDARRLHSGGLVDIETPSVTSSLLTIASVSEEHVGEYLCTIRNNYGEDLAQVMILLEGKR